MLALRANRQGGQAGLRNNWHEDEERHRLLEVQPATGRFARNDSNPLDCDLVVMEEASMVDVVLMRSVLRAVPSRASLILVGDVDQLPSVGPGSVLKDLIDCGLVPVVRLTEVFRQAAGDRSIVTAHRIRRGLMPELVQGVESDFHLSSGTSRNGSPPHWRIWFRTAFRAGFSWIRSGTCKYSAR